VDDDRAPCGEKCGWDGVGDGRQIWCYRRIPVRWVDLRLKMFRVMIVYVWAEAESIGL
jgi:hypothetical protein